MFFFFLWDLLLLWLPENYSVIEKVSGYTDAASFLAITVALFNSEARLESWHEISNLQIVFLFPKQRNRGGVDNTHGSVVNKEAGFFLGS